jgi:hypothetical protein
MVQELWQRRVENYWNLMGPKISSNTVRNVMDMKANMGSFAAALKDKDVWVMNVVPHDGPSTLRIVFDRGLIGTTHDWYLTLFSRNYCVASLISHYALNILLCLLYYFPDKFNRKILS